MGGVLRRIPHLRRTPPHFRRTADGDLRLNQSSARKIVDRGGFFDPEDRRNLPHLRSLGPKIEEPLPHLQSSIFGPGDRRTSPIFDLRPRRMGRRSGGEGGGGTSSKMGGILPRWGGFFDFQGPKNGEPLHLPLCRPEERGTSPIFHFLGPKNEEPSRHLFLLPTPPFDQRPTAHPSYLRYGSLDRSSTLEIGPQIVIGPLSIPQVNRLSTQYQSLVKLRFVSPHSRTRLA